MTKKIHIDGYNLDIDSTTEDVYPGSLPYAHPSAAATTTIVSDSVEDDGDGASGTGVLTMLIEGTGDDDEYLQSTATMNGVAAVTLDNDFKRINNIKVLTTGVGNDNDGIITVLHGASQIGYLAAGKNKSQMGIFTAYTLPNRWQIKSFYAHVTNNISGNASFILWTRKSGSVFLPRLPINLHGQNSPLQFAPLAVPIEIAPGEDVKVTCLTTANEMAVSCGYEILGGTNLR